jgi:hypothetical protein
MDDMFNLEKRTHDVLRAVRLFLSTIGAAPVTSLWVRRNMFQDIEIARDDFALDYEFIAVGPLFDSIQSNKDYLLSERGYVRGLGIRDPQRDLSQRWKDAQVSFHDMNAFKDVWIQDIDFRSMPPSAWGGKPLRGYIKVWDASTGTTRMDNPSRSSTKRTDEPLWRKIVSRVMAGNRGGKSGQWSARKAQLAVAEYKKAGGGYIGEKSPSNSLTRWTNQNWRTKSGLPSLQTGERYLPEKAIAALTEEEYKETSRAKRKGLKGGRQFAPQPLEIAAKTAKYRR